MASNQLNDILIILAAVAGAAAFLGLIVAPAWSSYSRVWERMAVIFLSLYVLAALVAVGAAGALVVVYLTT